MKNESKKNIKRVKIASWAAAVLPSIVIGSSLFSRKASESKEITHEHRHCEDEYLCGASPIDLGGISPLGIGDFPFNPGPGNTNPGDLFYEGPKYEGPNVANYHDQPVFVKDYFRNLKANFPTNDDDNNCGYVSAAMLLSYYDTCWNSSIVPDVFNNNNMTELDCLDDTDYQAPGVKDYNVQVWVGNYPTPMPDPGEFASEEKKSEYQNYTYAAYSLYMERMTSPTVTNKYIIPHLYKIAKDLNIIQFRDYSDPNYNWKKIIPLIDFERLGLVLSEYFGEIDELSNDKMTFNYVDLDRIGDFSTKEEKLAALRQAAIVRLKNGQPLIFGGDLRNGIGQKGSGHIAVAYEYDEVNDIIYGHIGWKGDVNTRVNFDEAFFEFNGFAYLTIADDLRASPNNHRFKIGNDYYESFALSSHVHSFEKPIHYGNMIVHALQCSCGEVQYERHTFPLVAKCRVCGR